MYPIYLIEFNIIHKCILIATVSEGYAKYLLIKSNIK